MNLQIVTPITTQTLITILSLLSVIAVSITKIFAARDKINILKEKNSILEKDLAIFKDLISIKLHDRYKSNKEALERTIDEMETEMEMFKTEKKAKTKVQISIQKNLMRKYHDLVDQVRTVERENMELVEADMVLTSQIDAYEEMTVNYEKLVNVYKDYINDQFRFNIPDEKQLGSRVKEVRKTIGYLSFKILK